jgi:hypothetical protein
MAVMIHTWSGQSAAEKIGVRPMTATSLIDCFPEAFARYNELLKESYE